MASPFDDLDRMLSGAVTDVFGEAAVLTPRIASQYVARAADPDRSSMSVQGIFSAGPGDLPVKGQATGGEFAGTTRLNVMKAEFWMSAAQVASLGYAPAKGDTISFPNRPGSPVYSVAAVQKTNLGDAALILVREDQSE